ncbi:hypothetical protein ACIG3E_37060 [Streptomyces sp. NPDC053474]|uniref:hypothetical protein n=1 Tax=Streptomyces sp. NPDC053474 TaxID=3365704 RepID=UPI0037D5E747
MREGLYGGLPAVAFAARTAVTRPGEYALLLTKLDAQVALLARRLVAEHAPRAGAALALRCATSPDAPLGEPPWQAALLLC